MTFIKKIGNYFIEAIAEMKKVTWPTKKVTKNYSLIVIGLSIGVAVFFGVFDYLFNIILGWII
ncbi:MAG: preprotein translocase subunit SecE [Candidatus Magasanikbacteria bacterium]